ncbi:MAG: hypothetical protein VX210_15620, partial [Myxococcota bacterium]|nr:hypothetical protein [Myxococcota bacterium]
MKRKLPEGLVIIAAVVAIGMVGSQLELGTLSGQAAGGDTAGCGGDAYYDEDLGALVDGEGNILDEESEGSAASSSDEFINLDFASHPAGEAMQGQNLVTIIRPDAALAAELDAASGANHEVRVAVSENGMYALVHYIAADHPELNEARLLRWSGDEWEAVFALSADRDEPVSLRTPMIVHVGLDDPDFGENVVFGFGFAQLLQYRAEDGAIRELNENTAPVVNELIGASMVERFGNLEGVEMLEAFTQNQGVRSFVERGLRHAWLEEFVTQHFGDDVEWNLNTSFNNRLLVSLSNGDILAIDACETGNTPLNAGGELVCTSCRDTEAGECTNVFNKVDALDIGFESLIEEGRAAFEAAQMSNMLLNQPRLSLSHGIAERLNVKSRCVGSAANCTHAYDAASTIYTCASSGSSCWPSTYNTGTDFAMKKGCTVAILGSQPSQYQDWIGRLGNFNVQSGHNNSSYHRGFENAIADLEAEGLSHCGSNTTWIGHSRGGAIATMLADKHGGTVYTYGAPPAFWDNLGDVPGDRYHAEWDPVPDLMHVVGIGAYHNVANSYPNDEVTECRKRKWGVCYSWRTKNRTKR